MDNQGKTKEELLLELKKIQQENDELRTSHKEFIAKSKLAAESHTESEEKFRGIFESNMLGTFFWDANGEISEANNLFLDIVGYSREELESGILKWKELTPSKYEKIDEVKLKELTERGKINPYEKEYIHKSGRIIPIIISAVTLSGSKSRGVAIIIDITDRKRLEETLNKERQRFKQILDNFPYGIYIVDKDYRIEYLNPILSQEFGDPGTRKCYDYFHDLPNPCQWCQNHKVFKGEIVYWEWHSTKNGKDFQLIGIPLNNTDGSISKLEVFQDITERKLSEKKMAISHEHEHFLGNLIRNASVAIGVGYPDGSLGLCNLAFQKLTGYSEEELKSIAWNSVLTPPEWLEREIQSLAKLHATKQSVIYQKEYIHKSGNRVPIELVVHPFYNAEGIVTHYYAFITDITERKLEEGKLTRALEKANESDRLKSTFLQNMSHEVRTPLNAIVGFSELMLLPNQTPEKLKTFSEVISTSSDKLIEIITDVIEISQIHSNQAKITLVDIDIISLVNKTVNQSLKKVEAKKIELVSNLNIPAKEYFIHSDKNKLESILSHIIDNAIKFTHQGRVEITSSIEKEMLNISISDTGIGISEEMQKAIFEPFRQVEIGTRRDFGGNGLGLSLAKSYVELLNGTITLKSEIGKGTTFHISIPAINAAKSTKQQLIPKQPNSITTILIVEDEYSNYLYLLQLLDDTSTKILYAENGQQALEFCKENNKIDLILMDIKMPVMDGHEAALLIKEIRPELPIIAQTAYALDTEKEVFISAFDDYIAKPIKVKELKQTLLKYITIER